MVQNDLTGVIWETLGANLQGCEKSKTGCIKNDFNLSNRIKLEQCLH